MIQSQHPRITRAASAILLAILQCSHPVLFAETTPPLPEAKSSITFQLPAPLWQAADENFSPSSPRLADLTGDGVLDIVQGDIENNGDSVIVAIDGKTGNELWRNRHTGENQDLFASAVFIDINGDGTPDPVIGGRSVDLIAADGKTGKTLWAVEKKPERALWGNFYSCQVVGDTNKDGVPDLVTANGGDQARDNNRQPGLLVLISGKTGEVLAKLVSPDRQETYMSPIVVTSTAQSGPFILYGTGGETLPGALWKISLLALQKEDSKGFIKLVQGTTKGFETPPAVGDFTADGIPDYLVQGFEGTITLVNGKDDRILWEVKNPGFESITIATPGFFVGNDQTPDVFAQISQGSFPAYTLNKQLLIDGITGQVVWSAQLGESAASGSIAVDLNGDGVDEVIFAINAPDSQGERLAKFYLFHTSGKELQLLHTTRRFAIASPWVGDMDGDGQLDLMLEGNTPEGKPTLNRYELEAKTPPAIRWGGYMGTTNNGWMPSKP